ncbi:MAG: hypothetical protein K2P99_03400 [Burkholderiales bacterium]|nr:hypothetical protein [Burkholderiales bacterium]
MNCFKVLIDFTVSTNNVKNKNDIISILVNKFSMIVDRKVLYNNEFAIRVSQNNTNQGFSNTILSLSMLQKYDSRPFFVYVIRSTNNYLLLANSTFIKKISHSSQLLSLTNIKGSFNGSDILKEFHDILNSAENFEKLFRIHESIGFEENFERIVNATKDITPLVKQHQFNALEIENIYNSIERTQCFIKSKYYTELKKNLDDKV